MFPPGNSDLRGMWKIHAVLLLSVKLLSIVITELLHGGDATSFHVQNTVSNKNRATLFSTISIVSL